MADQVQDPTQERKAGWMDWLKDPKNAVTAAVFVGSLLQDRNPGQSKLGAFGQRALGTLAFRGALEGNLHDQQVQDQQLQMQQQEQQSVQQYRAGQTAQGAERNHLEQRGQDLTAQTARDTQANQLNVARTYMAKTPQELAKMQADANEANARAGLYNQQANAKEGLFQSPYEAEMFKSWSEGRIAADPTKPPTPAEWLSYIQPYRNANAMAMSMMNQGIMPQVVIGKDGSVSVSVPGVLPSNNPAGANPGAAPAPMPATTGNVPTASPEILPAQVTQRKTAFQIAKEAKAQKTASNAAVDSAIGDAMKGTILPQPTSQLAAARKKVPQAMRRFRMGQYTVDDLAILRSIPKDELAATYSTLKPNDIQTIYGGP